MSVHGSVPLQHITVCHELPRPQEIIDRIRFLHERFAAIFCSDTAVRIHPGKLFIIKRGVSPGPEFVLCTVPGHTGLFRISSPRIRECSLIGLCHVRNTFFIFTAPVWISTALICGLSMHIIRNHVSPKMCRTEYRSSLTPSCVRQLPVFTAVWQIVAGAHILTTDLITISAPPHGYRSHLYSTQDREMRALEAGQPQIDLPEDSRVFRRR